jgi:hypothetical protein
MARNRKQNQNNVDIKFDGLKSSRKHSLRVAASRKVTKQYYFIWFWYNHTENLIMILK